MRELGHNKGTNLMRLVDYRESGAPESSESHQRRWADQAHRAFVRINRGPRNLEVHLIPRSFR